MVDLGPFPKGVNNRSPDHSVKKGSVRNAVNVDLDDEGNAKRREGLTKICDGLECYGGFFTPDGQYYRDGRMLKQFLGDNSPTTLLSLLTGSESAHCYQDGILYYSDGEDVFRIIGGAVTDWGLPAPGSPFLLDTSGTLGEGTYIGAIAWVDSEGREGPLSAFASVSLGANSGVIFSALPSTPSGLNSTLSYLRLYLSAANGDVLYRITDIAAASISTYTVNLAGFEVGLPTKWLPLGSPPPGRLITYYKGRIYIADDTGLIWYSEALTPHLFDLSNGYLQFPEAVTLMEGTDQGIYIAYGEKTKYYMGSPEEGFQIVDKYDEGAMLGSSERLGFDQGSAIRWMSTKGELIVGAADGTCQKAQDGGAALDTGTEAATIVRERDGSRHLIASIKDGQPNTVAASSWITAEVIRRS